MHIVISERQRRSNPHINTVRLLAGDIAQQDTDAIVTTLPQNLDYRGAINTAILAAAGRDIESFLRENIYNPRPGDVYAVPGFDLKCKHVLFCIVPVWRDDFERHNKHLLHACRKALETAREMSLKSLSIPPLASGKHGYPKPRAARLIVQGIDDRLDGSLDEVRIVCRAAETLRIFRDRLYEHGWAGD